MTVRLTDVPAGHTFDPISFTITADGARAYREGVDDRAVAYEEAGSAVPPLAVVALALGAILELVELPAGSLHASESCSFRRIVREGDTVECRPRLAQRSLRGGWVVSVLETDLYVEGSQAVLARATVLSPAT